MIVNEDIQQPPATFDPSPPAPELRFCAGDKTIPHVFQHIHTDESPRQAREANSSLCLTLESVYGKEITINLRLVRWLCYQPRVEVLYMETAHHNCTSN